MTTAMGKVKEKLIAGDENKGANVIIYEAAELQLVTVSPLLKSEFPRAEMKMSN
jgi:hypothetical protein